MIWLSFAPFFFPPLFTFFSFLPRSLARKTGDGKSAIANEMRAKLDSIRVCEFGRRPKRWRSEIHHSRLVVAGKEGNREGEGERSKLKELSKTIHITGRPSIRAHRTRARLAARCTCRCKKETTEGALEARERGHTSAERRKVFLSWEIHPRPPTA